MNEELYKKMTDDEKLQHINNLQRVKDSLAELNVIQKEIIGLYKRLVVSNDGYTIWEEERKMANKKYRNFDYKMMEKYDKQSLQTCDAIPTCTKNGGDLSSE